MNEDFNPRDYPDGVEDDDYEVTGCGDGDAAYDDSMDEEIRTHNPGENDAAYDDSMDEEIRTHNPGENDAAYDDSMDGDWDSGMASAGFGTDEDYGFAEDVY